MESSQNLLNQLQHRFRRDIYYTPIAHQILIYLNSNKRNKDEDIQNLTKKLLQNLKSGLEKHQVIYLAGESGSGKTFNGTEILKSFKVPLHTSIVIEAFGNAKSALNDNASRFAKFHEIEFDWGGNFLSENIFTFLFDKWRLTNKTTNERNFHIFYYLLSAEPSILKNLKLRRNGNYKLIWNNNSELNYRSEFSLFKTSLEKLNLPCHEILKILAGIIKCGELEFHQTYSFDGAEVCGIEPQFELLEASDLLDMNLRDYLTYEGVSRAAERRDLLIVEIYSRLFAWIAVKLNDRFKGRRSRTISVIDFPGFQRAGENRLAQFLMNHSTEVLEKVFVDGAIFKEEFNFEKNGHGLIKALTNDSHSLKKSPIKLKHYGGTVTYSELNNHNREYPIDVLITRPTSLIAQLFPPPGSGSGRWRATFTEKSENFLKNLLKLVDPRRIFYIRCLQVNELCSDSYFEPALVRFQIEFLKLEELRGTFMSYTFLLPVFLKRYKLLSLRTWPSFEVLSFPEDAIADVILSDLGIDRDAFTITGGTIIISFDLLEELESYRNERLDDLATDIQRLYRGYRARKNFSNLRSSQVKISHYWRNYQERKETLRKEEEERRRRAVLVIESAYLALQRQRFIHGLIKNPPSDSPISKAWPSVPPALSDVSLLLKKIFHRWRCGKYRGGLKEGDVNRLGEKLTASLLFRGRKASYAKSVSHPFIGDYLRLRQNTHWLRSHSEPEGIVFADLMHRVTRSSGKFVPIVLVITGRRVLVLDRNFTVKYRVDAEAIWKMSLSPHDDGVSLLHVREEMEARVLQDKGCSFLKNEEEGLGTKGDLVLVTTHAIEMVTKIFLVVKNRTGHSIPIDIRHEIPAVFNSQGVCIRFGSSGPEEESGTCGGGLLRVVRKGCRMDFNL